MVFQEQRLALLEDLTDLRGGPGRANAHVLVGRAYPQLVKEQLIETRVVVLAGVDEDVLRGSDREAESHDDRRMISGRVPRIVMIFMPGRSPRDLSCRQFASSRCTSSRFINIAIMPSTSSRCVLCEW